MGLDFEFNSWTIVGVAAVAAVAFVLWRVLGRRGGTFGKDSKG